MKVCLITATKDRHRQLERVVRFMMNQTYQNIYHLIFNNSTTILRKDEQLDDRFVIINQSLSSSTQKPYTNLGDIYNDIIPHIPEDCEVVSFADDDDIFLPNHVEEGIKGLMKGGLKAYKPHKSWYKHGKQIELVSNVLEPSIFVKADHIREFGFSQETTAQHLQWVNPLVQNKEIFEDIDGIPTYICDWSQEIPTFKTSGDPDNPHNFHNYTQWSKDKGDGVVSPCSQSWAEHYYRTP